jgi:hypothetical protein
VSDEHSGLSHDLPEYVPNWPLPVRKVKVQVYQLRGTGEWAWAHDCPRKIGFTLGFARPTQAEAFAAAHKHVQGCW